MQRTTELLYQGFLADLQTAGFDVVSAEQLASSNAYKAYAVNSPATPRKEEAESQKSNGAGAITSVFYTPPGVPLVLGDKFDHLATGRVGGHPMNPVQKQRVVRDQQVRLERHCFRRHREGARPEAGAGQPREYARGQRQGAAGERHPREIRNCGAGNLRIHGKRLPRGRRFAGPAGFCAPAGPFSGGPDYFPIPHIQTGKKLI